MCEDRALDPSYPVDWKTGAWEKSRDFCDRLAILIMVFINYVFNTHVDTNQIALYVSICLADAV